MNRTKVLFVLLIGFICLNCSNKNDDKVRMISEKSENYKSSWDDLVVDSTQINLRKVGLNESLTNLTHMGFLSDNKLVIPDGYNKEVVILNEDGKLYKKIKNIGKGPGEFQGISRIKVDQKDNIYLFDPSQRKILVYHSPKYETYDEFFTENYISRFDIVAGEKKLLTYSPYTEYLFNKIDLEKNEVLESSIIPNDEEFKIWMARIQSGEIVYNHHNDKVYGLYPEELAIYEFTPNLELVSIISPQNRKTFYEEFPENLDPYGHNLHHEEWWRGFNHLARLKLLDKGKFVVTYSGKSGTKDNNGVFLNIYNFKKNKIIANNIELPPKANLAGINNGEMYISYKAQLNENGEEILFRLVKYKISI